MAAKKDLNAEETSLVHGIIFAFVNGYFWSDFYRWLVKVFSCVIDDRITARSPSKVLERALGSKRKRPGMHRST